MRRHFSGSASDRGQNAETQQIDVIMYRVTDKRHSDAMIAALARGIPIRYLGETVEYRDPDRLWVAWNMDRMFAAGIPMRVRASEGQNHEKLMLLEPDTYLTSPPGGRQDDATILPES